MGKRKQKGQIPLSPEQQPYDSVLKLLLEKQEAAILPYLLSEIEFLEVLDLEVLRSPLRVDRVYKIRYRGEEHILHIEFESASNNKMASRLLIYNAYFWDKFELPVISIVVYPFETAMCVGCVWCFGGQKDILTFHFRVLPLWKLDAQFYLDIHAVSMYGLLPTMQGANLQTLTSAINELQVYYKGDETRFRRELLCFRTLLERATVVPFNEKLQLKERLNMFNNLLEEDPYIQQKKAEGIAEGEARGEAKGETKGELKALRKAVITIVKVRFPALTELAQEQVAHVNKPDVLDYLIEKVAVAPDESVVQFLLSSTAA